MFGRGRGGRQVTPKTIHPFWLFIFSLLMNSKCVSISGFLHSLLLFFCAQIPCVPTNVFYACDMYEVPQGRFVGASEAEFAMDADQEMLPGGTKEHLWAELPPHPQAASIPAVWVLEEIVELNRAQSAIFVPKMYASIPWICSAPVLCTLSLPGWCLARNPYAS